MGSTQSQNTRLPLLATTLTPCGVLNTQETLSHAAPGGVYGDKAAPGGVCGGKAAPGGVYGGKVAPGGVCGGKAAPGGVCGGKAAPGGVCGGKAAPGGVCGGKAAPLGSVEVRMEALTLPQIRQLYIHCRKCSNDVPTTHNPITTMTSLPTNGGIQYCGNTIMG